jgi:hypothetical protein
MLERTLFMVILSYWCAQCASRSSVSLQSSVQDGKTSGSLAFHPALAEKEIGDPLRCVEVLPGLRSLCVCGFKCAGV